MYIYTQIYFFYYFYYTLHQYKGPVSNTIRRIWLGEIKDKSSSSLHNFSYKSVSAWSEIFYYLIHFCGSSNICPFRLQRGKKHQIENGSGAEDNGDSSHCSNASVHSNQEAGPSIKRTKTSDDSGLDMDNTTENGGGDTALDGASEIELVFRPHPTLMEKEDAAQTRWHGVWVLFYISFNAILHCVKSEQMLKWNNITVSLMIYESQCNSYIDVISGTNVWYL